MALHTNLLRRVNGLFNEMFGFLGKDLFENFGSLAQNNLSPRPKPFLDLFTMRKATEGGKLQELAKRQSPAEHGMKFIEEMLDNFVHKDKKQRTTTPSI